LIWQHLELTLMCIQLHTHGGQKVNDTFRNIQFKFDATSVRLVEKQNEKNYMYFYEKVFMPIYIQYVCVCGSHEKERERERIRNYSNKGNFCKEKILQYQLFGIFKTLIHGASRRVRPEK